jgi:hypothetical protein
MGTDTLQRATQALRQIALQSRAASVARRAGRRVALVPLAARVRSLGVLLLTANVTSLLLLLQAPPMTRPAAPSLLRWEMAALSVVMMVCAPALARSWPTSRLRRILRGQR